MKGLGCLSQNDQEQKWIWHMKQGKESRYAALSTRWNIVRHVSTCEFFPFISAGWTSFKIPGRGFVLKIGKRCFNQSLIKETTTYWKYKGRKTTGAVVIPFLLRKYDKIPISDSVIFAFKRCLSVIFRFHSSWNRRR